VVKKGLYGLMDENGVLLAPVLYKMIDVLTGSGNDYIFSLDDKKYQTFYLTRDHKMIKESNE
jgi:hypothetical protein